MAAGGGGAWKVAYADFVTAMMAFFLVMWITAQSNAVKQSIARYFSHPYDATSRSAVPSKSSSGSSLIPLHREMDASLPRGSAKGKVPRGGGMLADDQPPPNSDAVPKSGGLKRRSGLMLHDGDASGIGTEVQFADTSVQLDERGKQTLDAALPAFQGKRNKVEIRSHMPADLANTTVNPAPEVSTRDPWQISYSRCQVVRQYLERHGIEPKRIRLSQAGPIDSLPSDDEPDLQTRDSRVEVYMLPEYVDEYLGRGGQPEVRASAELTPKGTADAKKATSDAILNQKDPPSESFVHSQSAD